MLKGGRALEKIIITNNDKVFKKYKGKFEIIYLENASYTDVLYETRNYIHSGCKLITHPMAGSLKPNQTPYKSVIVGKEEGKIDYNCVILIENSLDAANKFLKNKATPKWNEKILNDFKTVDLSLIENVIINPMFNIY